MMIHIKRLSVLPAGAGRMEMEMKKAMRPSRAGTLSRPKRKGREVMPDYGSWHFTRREFILNCTIYAGLDLLIAMLFFRSRLAALLFSPGLPLFLKMRKKDLLEQRRLEMLRQFTTGMQLVNASLQAGYAIENAWKEALNELRKIYEPDSFIVTEFRYIILQTSLNVPIEGLLLDLGRRSHVDDVRNFAEVFQTAKRTGGDLMSIIRNTVSAIQSKNETRQEIEANITGKVSEQRIMCIVPLALIGYITITSPGFLDPCYHNPAGIFIMTISLIVYVIAFFIGKRIMHIEV